MNWLLKEAEYALEKFPYPIRKPSFLILNQKKFLVYLKDSPLSLNIEKTPSFVAHLPDRELVCLCSDTINLMTKGKSENYKLNFIRAIIMHELFHIRNMHLALTESEALRSEEEVHQQLKTEFPALAKILSCLEK